jgi:hypothetical protein
MELLLALFRYMYMYMGLMRAVDWLGLGVVVSFVSSSIGVFDYSLVNRG